AMDEHGIGPIDLLAVNLYPFRETVASGAGRGDCVEKIDIGGPAMLRAAAKNHDSVAVLSDPADYDRVIEQMDAGGLQQELLRDLAAKAFAHTASYDSAVAGWMNAGQEVAFPPSLVLAGELGET